MTFDNIVNDLITIHSCSIKFYKVLINLVGLIPFVFRSRTSGSLQLPESDGNIAYYIMPILNQKVFESLFFAF